MIIKFDTLNEEQVQEVISYLTMQGYLPALEAKPLDNSENKPIEAPNKPEKQKKVKEVAKKPSAVNMDDLKAEAKAATKRAGRVAVKDTINKYAVKLSEVKEEDYEKLLEELKEL